MHQNVRIRKNRYGRGLYARRNLRRGALIEVSPVIVINRNDVGDDEMLSNYVFEWSRGKRAVALGMGSLFNHSSTVPNAWWEVVRDKKVLRFYAAKDIREGDEIFVNYGYRPG